MILVLIVTLGYQPLLPEGEKGPRLRHRYLAVLAGPRLAQVPYLISRASPLISLSGPLIGMLASMDVGYIRKAFSTLRLMVFCWGCATTSMR